MNINYPLFLQDRDKWMYIITSPAKLNNLENIDIEGREYICWDVAGKPIELYVENKEIKVKDISGENQIEQLKKAILNYAVIARPKNTFDYNELHCTVVELFSAVEAHIKSARLSEKLKRIFNKKGCVSTQ